MELEGEWTGEREGEGGEGERGGREGERGRGRGEGKGRGGGERGRWRGGGRGKGNGEGERHILYPRSSQTGAPICVLGEMVSYERRRPGVCCLIDPDSTMATNRSTCLCSSEDFEWLAVSPLIMLRLLKSPLVQ